MKWLPGLLCGTVLLSGGTLDEFVTYAKQTHGDMGERAARFLVENMPDRDRETLTIGFLTQNLDLAFRAREEYPWAAKVPEEIFFNDVLPYAVFDEPRDPWRAELYGRLRDIVKDAASASEAAQRLNQQVFNLVNVHYNTGRKRPNQSLKQSMELGMATCTGLSIILVNACRTVGIPARGVGTPMWTNKRGNHTWVEVWDEGWHFTGADEYDPAGLDRGWFVGDAALAQADVPRHAIYATSWKREGLAFPTVWSRRSRDVAGVNVTDRYAKTTTGTVAVARLGVRLWDVQGGSRLVAKVTVLDSSRRPLASGQTKAGTADLNDMPRFELPPGTQGWMRFTVDGETRELAFEPVQAGDPTLDVVWGEM